MKVSDVQHAAAHIVKQLVIASGGVDEEAVDAPS
jgi:hypothetical protein